MNNNPWPCFWFLFLYIYLFWMFSGMQRASMHEDIKLIKQAMEHYNFVEITK